jgi:hypothetical protein
MKTRIDIDGAIEWARTALRRELATALSGASQAEQDAALLEYNLAHGVVVDGIYQDVDNRRVSRKGAK